MEFRLQVLAILVSLFVLLLSLELIRKGRLRSEYSLGLILGAGVLLFLSAFRGTLVSIADFLGIGYAPTLLLMVGLGGVVAIQIIHAMAISNLRDQNRVLAERLAIAEWRNSLRKESAEPHPLPLGALRQP